MPLMAPGRHLTDVDAWLDLDGDGGPAGPLFSGRYTAHEITMTGGGGPVASAGATGCYWCTGSVCDGYILNCGA